MTMNPFLTQSTPWTIEKDEKIVFQQNTMINT